MFHYWHFRSDLLPVVYSFTNPDVTGINQTRLDGDTFVIESLATFAGEATGTSRISWVTNTFPKSVTNYSRTSFETNLFSDANENYGGETVTTVNLSSALYSSGVDDHTYTAPATQTYAFSTVYFSNTSTTISGTAAATGTTTGTRTLTISAVTMGVRFNVPEGFNEHRTYVTRQLPWAEFANNASIPSGRNRNLRAVALAYGFGEVGTSLSSRSASSLSAGNYSFESTALTTTSSSQANTDFSITSQYIRWTDSPRTYMAFASVKAFRRSYQGSVFFDTGGTTAPAMSWDGSAQMISPTVSPAFSPFALIGSNIFLRKIFTTVQTGISGSGYSIGGSSARLAWSYLSSSWKLLATKFNSSGSSTLEISLATASSALTTTVTATVAHGLETMTNAGQTLVLGPQVPFPTSSFLVITVEKSSRPYESDFSHESQFILLEGLGTTSALSSASSSFYSVTSSSTFSNGTLNSNLPVFSSVYGLLSLTTSSYSGDYVADSQYGNRLLIYPNSKWNEAGPNDAVPVLQ